MNKGFLKKYFQSLGAILGVVLVAFMIVMGFDFTGGARLQAEKEGGGLAVANGGTINVLLMCTDADGYRTDAMILASYNTEENTVNMLSVPRDLRMYVGNRYQKVNAAHAFSTNGQIGGAVATCEAVSRLTGVTINYYVDFSFDTVAKVMDRLGPVTFTIPDLYGDGVGMVYDDPAQDLHINLPPGTRNLNGEQIVHLLRYRKGNKDPRTGISKGYVHGDEDRIKMQQEFIKTLVDQKLNLSLIQKIPSIFSDVMNDIDTNLTIKDVISYSKYLADFTSAGIRSETIPGDNTNDSANGDVFIPNMDKLKYMVSEMFAGTDTSKMSYANPNQTATLYSDGYRTTGGFVRTRNTSVLSGLHASEVSNDELCLIRGIDQTFIPPTPTPVAADTVTAG